MSATQFSSIMPDVALAIGSWKSPASPKPALLTRISTSSPASARRAASSSRPAVDLEVGGEDVGAPAAFLGELAGELDQAVLAAGDERQPVAAAGQLARDLDADARGGAGDERDGALGGRRKSHRAAG